MLPLNLWSCPGLVDTIKGMRNTLTFWTYVSEKEPSGVPLTYKNRGDLFYKTGQFDKALADYDKAIELAPRY